MDSDQQSKAELSVGSGKDIEKDTIDCERDVEKQTQDDVSPADIVAVTDAEPKDLSLVEFDGPDDPDNPKNWTVRRRATITIAMGLMTFVVTFSSSIFAVAIEPVAQEFNVGIPVTTLGVSFFLLVSDSARSDPFQG